MFYVEPLFIGRRGINGLDTHILEVNSVEFSFLQNHAMMIEDGEMPEDVRSAWFRISDRLPVTLDPKTREGARREKRLLTLEIRCR